MKHAERSPPEGEPLRFACSTGASWLGPSSSLCTRGFCIDATARSLLEPVRLLSSSMTNVPVSFEADAVRGRPVLDGFALLPTLRRRASCTTVASRLKLLRLHPHQEQRDRIPIAASPAF